MIVSQQQFGSDILLRNLCVLCKCIFITLGNIFSKTVLYFVHNIFNDLNLICLIDLLFI